MSKISQLTAASSLTGAESIPIVQSGNSRKVPVSNILTDSLFTPAGAGAVVRSLQDKLRDIVSLKDFATSGNYDTAKFALAGSKYAIGGLLELESSTAGLLINGGTGITGHTGALTIGGAAGSWLGAGVRIGADTVRDWGFRTETNGHFQFYDLDANAGTGNVNLSLVPEGNVYVCPTQGDFGIGTPNPTPGTRLHVVGGNPFFENGAISISLESTNAYNTSAREAITGIGKYTSSGTFTPFAAIDFGKINTSDGNFGGNLKLYTVKHGVGTMDARVSVDDTGTQFVNKIFPGTDAAAFQTACGVYAGTGAPNNANGNNGDYYYRSDGTAAPTATKDHCYFKAAGAWGGVF